MPRAEIPRDMQTVVTACRLIADTFEGYVDARASIAESCSVLELALGRVPVVMHDGEDRRMLVDEKALAVALEQVQRIRNVLDIS